MMSVEIVIILIGAVLLFIAAADGLLSLGLVHIKARVVMSFIGMLLIIYGGFSYGAINPQGPIEKVSIGNKLKVEYPIKNVQVTSPIQEDSVKCRVLTMGVYPEGHTQDIWVLLKPSNNRLYPQSDHTNTSFKLNGEWQVITRFGGDKGESYEIIIYETDEAASDFFSATIQEWKDDLEYPGLDAKDIPAGAREIERIRVYLMDNCRGVF